MMSVNMKFSINLLISTFLKVVKYITWSWIIYHYYQFS